MKSIKVFVCVLLFITPKLLLAETIVSENISTDTFWSKVHSPYIIDTTISIAPHTKLVIGAGVEVVMNGTLTNLGELYVAGTDQEPVTITSDQNPWLLNTVYTATTTLEHVMVHNLNTLYAQDASLHLNSVRISDSLGGITVNHSHLNLIDSQIASTTVSSIVAYNFSTSTLKNVILQGGTENGIENYLNSTLTVSNSTISGFAKSGLLTFLAASSSVTTTNISNNTIGIYAYNNSHVSIDDSEVSNNAQWGIQTQSPVTIEAKENWWGDTSGPYNAKRNSAGLGNAVGDDVIFVPWQTQRVSGGTTCCSNVLFIPGLEGSRLYDSNATLWEPGSNADVEKLYLDESGQSITANIYTKDIIDRPKLLGLSVGQSIYSGFISFLNRLITQGSVTSWQAFAYDWRHDPMAIARSGTLTDTNGTLSTLEQNLQGLAQTSKTGKVTIIAHSNGGLIAKSFIKYLTEAGKTSLLDVIDTLVLVAVPELGSPLAVPALLHGYDQDLVGGLLLNKSVARSLAVNMPDAYTLLPSDPYFKDSAPLITFDPSVKNFPELKKYAGSTIGSADQLAAFITDTNRKTVTKTDTEMPLAGNKKLVTAAHSLHDQLDNWQLPSSINVVRIIGTGISTLMSSMYKQGCYIPSLCQLGFWLDLIPNFSVTGDGVVPTKSVLKTGEVHYINLAQTNRENNENRDHKNILETTKAQEMVTDILTHTNSVSVQNTAEPSAAYWNISVHSPVDLIVMDNIGRQTGASTTPTGIKYKLEEIPNSKYFEVGEGAYVLVNEPIQPRIKISGTGFGTFTVSITKTLSDESTTTVFANIPTNPETGAEITVSETVPTLRLDSEGDGIFESTIKPQTNFNAVLYIDALKRLVQKLEISDAQKNKLLKRIETLQKKIANGQIANVEKIIRTLEKRFFENTHRHHILTTADRETIIKLLEALLTALI